MNRFFDHTVLKPSAVREDIVKLCREARENSFYAVCVNSCYVELAKKELSGADVKIAAVVGFPLGAAATEVKAFEAAWACSHGALEIDMVLSVGALKDKRYDYIVSDIAAVVEAAGKQAAVKVILETCLLTDGEIIKACQLSEQAGAAFVKTSTGFSTGGADTRHVALMKKTVGSRVMVKASGGIRDLTTAMAMIEAGADRIGTSASVEIMEEYDKID